MAIDALGCCIAKEAAQQGGCRRNFHVIHATGASASMLRYCEAERPQSANELQTLQIDTARLV
jgi:hypothetical protein